MSIRDKMENELRYAVLIDADNISDKYIKIILEEAAANGVRVLAVRCRVRPESMEILGFVPVIMEER